ncbi:MAG: DNA topoisomerase III [Bacteroidales bacterium]|nr:DNA topoisomerase 3 [Anaerotignum sp.]MCI5678549.1 DNA topoisomerase III [Bacteroidales bacterium]MDY3926072.1 DNA topoisomerase 3 [Anaerotignum sp.]
MGKILVIAEKPSVARDIAKVLIANQKGDGCLIGEKYIVSWAVGHLVTLAEPEEYDPKYKKWNFSTLPILPEEMKLKAIAQTRSQLKVLHKWMHSKEIDSLICATDSGREGELIFRYIYEITKCTKPFERLWISSMTEEAIKEGFATLKDGREYDLLYTSAKCRSEADWLVGMNATRAYTLRYDALLSIGRVQTPTLAIIVDRQKEIDAFVAEDYFEVQADFGGYTGMWIDKEEHTRIEKEETAKAVVEKVSGKNARITKVEKEEKKMPPPLLYDLTELQRDCNKKFGFSAKKTLDIAQSLYEKRKMITYPRTDSRYLSDDMKGKVRNTIKRLQELEAYAPYAQPLTENISFTKRIIDNSKVTDHHAIIPTDAKLRLDSLTEEEDKVFSLVAARFLAVFYPYYRYETTKVYAEAEGERFLSKGTVVLEEGWQAVEKALTPAAAAKKKKKDEEEQKLPALTEGKERKIEKATVQKKKTKPPTPYTESSLLSAMENAGRFVEDEALKEQMKDSGLGTPATRAAIIERLLTVGYIVRKGKTLVPTEKGRKLIEVVPNEMRSPQTTGKWEKGLSSIAKGNMTEERFMASIRRYVQFLIQDAASGRRADVVFPEEQIRGKKRKNNVFGKCPICGRDILENTKSFYCAGWKSGCKFSLWKDSLKPYGLELDGGMVKLLLKNGKTEPMAVTLPQTGEKGTAVLILNKDKGGQIEIMDFTRES